VGEQLISISAGHPAGAADVAFIVKQTISLDNFQSTTPARHYKRFLCLKNAPDIAAFSSYSAALAADLSTLMKTSNQFIGTALPARVSAVAISLSGTNQASPLSTTCDPASHTIIADYATGKVVSVNPNATLEVYETPN
jgi:hypothetical protein